MWPDKAPPVTLWRGEHSRRTLATRGYASARSGRTTLDVKVRRHGFPATDHGHGAVAATTHANEAEGKPPSREWGGALWVVSAK